MASPAHRPSKRARTTAGQSALTAPFKSPMRRPTSDTPSSNPSTSTPVSSVHGNSNAPSPVVAMAQRDSHKIDGPTSTTATVQTRASSHPTAPSAPSHTPTDPDHDISAAYALLRREHTSSLTQLAQLKAQLETTTQAAHILASPRDVELKRLLDLWRSASQAAAEELFSVARDQVSGMGGMGGWREKELAKRERLEEWGAEGEKSDSEDQDEGGGDYGEIDRPGGTRRGEREKLSKAEKVRLKEEQKWACEDAAGGLGEERKKEVWEEGDADDDAFTMDMMLRSMNIDLDLIGYDRDSQRWVG